MTLSDEMVERRMQRFLPRKERYQIKYKSIYRVHQRVAKEFRLGRVLLAGDAAHLNNPMGAFGLNGGIHDSIQPHRKAGEGVPRRGRRVAARPLRAPAPHCEPRVRPGAFSIRNLKRLNEKSEEKRRQNFEELRRQAVDAGRQARVPAGEQHDRERAAGRLHCLNCPRISTPGGDIMANATPRPPFRADHVGSLLRPQELHDARDKARAGEMSCRRAAAVAGQAHPRGRRQAGVGRHAGGDRRRVPPRLVAHRLPRRLRRGDARQGRRLRRREIQGHRGAAAVHEGHEQDPAHQARACSITSSS